MIIFIILFGGIGFTTAMNWWQTESSKTPAKFSEGEAAGHFNPADIRGSYTFADIERNFAVPAAELAVAFAIDTDDPGSVGLKDLETIYATTATAEDVEVGTASVRLFVALYTGLPYEITEETFLPQPAVKLLIARGGLTDEQIQYLQSHTVGELIPAEAVEETPAPTLPASDTQDNTSDERLIKGKTSFQEVLDWGVSQDTIEAVLGVAIPNRLTKIKDFCLEKGLEFETVKATLQAEVDKIVP
jgi:hypothetical protein